MKNKLNSPYSEKQIERKFLPLAEEKSARFLFRDKLLLGRGSEKRFYANKSSFPENLSRSPLFFEVLVFPA
ncbi:MAG: hypothetical protein A2007_06265 [Verrucomicrobia bacterium GWC2_42_7]|nr:MAG: hypothetical protein A2007_06265 [Verrucomicrobia bacterium GWC2_42_7]